MGIKPICCSRKELPSNLHKPFKELKLISLAFMNGVIDTGVDVKLIFLVEYAVVCVYKMFL